MRETKTLAFWDRGIFNSKELRFDFPGNFVLEKLKRINSFRFL